MNLEAVRQKIDVAITATLRPEVLDLTLFSFFKHFLRQFRETRLIVNVDPLGDGQHQASELVNVCRRYSARVVSRCPTAPSFSSAVKWCWEQIESDVFLHLEDDWLLQKPIRMESVLARLEAAGEVASVRFNLTRNPATNPPLFPLLSLNPSVIRRECIEQALPLFSCEQDPEKQFGNVPQLARWKYAYYGEPGETAYVIDIGKKWRRLHEFQKWSPGNPAVSWERGISQAAPLMLFYRLKYTLFMFYWRRIVV